jgi:hypothetical protein
LKWVSFILIFQTIVGEAVQIAESVDRTNVAAPPPPKRPSAKPVVAKEWDIDNPGWPFVGLPLHDGVDLAANPHLAQNDVGFFRVPMEMIPKCMHAEMGVKKYTWIAKNKRSTSHAGWKKLIMQEIDFLSEYGERGMLVIYAGAAPGAQFPILTQMFPYLSFVLLGKRSNRKKVS